MRRPVQRREQQRQGDHDRGDKAADDGVDLVLEAMLRSTR